MGIAIGLGLSVFPFETAKAFWRWVALCEDSAVDSIWQTDRLVSREPMLECMSTMAALAGGTTRLKFGMNVASVGLRDPLLLAKQCATIDVLSEGRLLPAFGLGHVLAPDWQATGRPTKGRGKRSDEALEIIGRLWHEEKVDFHGEFFTLEGATIAPRPVQKRLPLWLGGSSEAAVRRTARFGTGWLAGLETPDQVAPVVRAIKAAAKAAGRRIDDEHYGAGIPFRFGSWDEPAVKRQAESYAKRFKRDPSAYFAVGDTEAIIACLRAYVGAGVSKFVLRPLAGGDDIMAQTQRLIDEVLPAIPTLAVVPVEA